MRRTGSRHAASATRTARPRRTPYATVAARSVWWQRMVCLGRIRSSTPGHHGWKGPRGAAAHQPGGTQASTPAGVAGGARGPPSSGTLGGVWGANSRDLVDIRITTSDGVGLAAEVGGAGPGLLLVHGLGGGKEDFDDHVHTLARDTRSSSSITAGTGRATSPPTGPRIRSPGWWGRVERSPTRLGSTRSACSVIRWAEWSYVSSCCGTPERVDTLGDDGHVGGPVPGVPIRR